MKGNKCHFLPRMVPHSYLLSQLTVAFTVLSLVVVYLWGKIEISVNSGNKAVFKLDWLGPSMIANSFISLLLMCIPPCNSVNINLKHAWSNKKCCCFNLNNKDISCQSKKIISLTVNGLNTNKHSTLHLERIFVV